MRNTTSFLKAVFAALFLTGALACQPDIIFEETGSDEEEGTLVANTNGSDADKAKLNVEAGRSKYQNDWPSYKVATLEYFPPFVMRDELRVPQGFDIDVLNAIASEQQFNVMFVPQTWESCLPSLDSGARSMVATGVIMLPERVASYTFTEPYLDSGYAAVLKDDPKKGGKLTNFEDIFKDETRTFVTMRDSAGETMLRKLLNDDMSRVTLVDSLYDEIRQVMTDKVDTAFDISVVLQYYVHKQNDKTLYLLHDPNAEVQHIGFALKKGNTELKQKVDEGIKAIKANGKYDQIYEKWFGARE